MIGDRSPRVEDARLLTGGGRYLADVAAPGAAHVALWRSPVAHAAVRSIDTSDAAALPGVLAVVTQVDLAGWGARRLSHRLAIPGLQPLSWGILAEEVVRFVGEPLVAVVAVDRATAEDAVELLDVDLDVLPAVVDPEAALAPDAPLLYPDWGTNAFLHLPFETPGLRDALDSAPHVLAERISSHRITVLPLETHGVVAERDARTGQLLVHASQQQPHQLRTVIAETCGLSEADVRVVAPDTGGGFGNKQHFTREECLVALLALHLDRPVRWVQDRTEGLTGGIHSREQVHEVTVGYDHDGRVLAWHSRIVANVGNPVLYFSGIGPALVTIGSLTGGYAVPEVGYDLTCVATTTCSIGAYRGFGQPQAHLATERVLDLIAGALDLDPVTVRRRNLLPAGPRPWFLPNGSRIDCGDLDAQVDALLDAFDYGGWRARQAAARADGRYVGIGFSTLVQGGAPTQHGVAGRFGSYETATVSVLPDGKVVVEVGTTSQGQAHETVFAQIAADVLDLPLDDVTVRWGDTASIPYGMGTWGSRSAVMGGGAVHEAASEVREKVEKLAAVIGTEPSTAAAADLCWFHPHRLPEGFAPGLSATVVYTPGHTKPEPDEHGGPNFDETFGSHMTAVVVEVDPDTGGVTVLDAVMVVDCGRVINPTVVEGQVQGGFVQGVGNVLWEEVVYDDDGQPQCSTLLDYQIPQAADAPVLRVEHRPTPSDLAGGFRGVGEAGITAAPAAMAGAVADALAPLGVRITSTRLHAHHLRAALRAAGHRSDPARFARR